MQQVPSSPYHVNHRETHQCTARTTVNQPGERGATETRGRRQAAGRFEIETAVPHFFVENHITRQEESRSRPALPNCSARRRHVLPCGLLDPLYDFKCDEDTERTPFG